MAEAKITIKPLGLQDTAKQLRSISTEMRKQRKEVKRVNIAYKRLQRTQQYQRKIDALAKYNAAQNISRMDKFKNSVVSFRGAIAAAGVYGFGRFVAGSIEASNAMVSAENGFVRLASNRGIGGARKWLEKYNDSLDGMVDRATVASRATQLLATNSNLTAKQVQVLFRYSRNWADSTGRDLLPVVDQLSSAFGGLELETLRRLGLEVDFTQALKDGAKAMNKQVSELTESEKRAIRTSEAYNKLINNQKMIGQTAITAANSLKRIGSAWTNIQANLGLGFAEGLGGPLEALGDVMSGKLNARAAAGKAVLSSGVLGLELGEAITGMDFKADTRRQELNALGRDEFDKAGAVGAGMVRANMAVSTMGVSELYYGIKGLWESNVRFAQRITG